MKKYLFCLLVLFLLAFSCKSVFKSSNEGSFSITNYSKKTIEFVWIAPEGEFYPTGKNLSIGYGESYEEITLSEGRYDIAIDFKDEFNSFNSKKDKNLCLVIEKGIKKIWIVDADGNIVRN
ncbi:MAG: hypothetical protein A2086_15690 [Spirochaetes bacterium GWD1_27_9]|nr:MAG: hypothetical protein A2Z98_10960 [Spirochaetes bacterium GWB1_27_13]OHD22477.1 MAG: hypothetical protein A2Y34_06660 [Spirochaetes bacterium GWC1_27_15]OHD42824.1 MAG: hypothetical protein A2086_15690 [Spirochaetes bacterium GWD1_27_9]